MPIYAYRCEGCGFQKDALQKMSDPPLVDCPACGQPRMVKQLTAAGFALKGTGWYVTDFRDQAKKPSTTGKGDAATSDAPAATDTSAPAVSPGASGSETRASEASAPPAAPVTSSNPASSS
jgi:putative FmdB family regulatory protein